MIRDHSHRENRSAFTLVELLVVILIIAILVSLLASGVMKALGKIPEVQTRTEISEMEVALQAFMMDYNLSDPPPSNLVLNENVGPGSYLPTDPSFLFLQKMFGRTLTGTGPPLYWVDWNGDGVQNGPWILQGQQCLVFYLGGIPNTAAVAGGMPPAPQGFSSSNINPSAPSLKRKGPYFQFVTTRLFPVPVLGGFNVYLDPWQVKASANGIGPLPYVYFSSSGNNNGYNYMDCAGALFTDLLGPHFALPYWTGVGASPTGLTYTYGNSFQIISAGKDGKFGYSPGVPPVGALNSNLWNPLSGAVGTGADDQANFSSTLLAAGQN